MNEINEIYSALKSLKTGVRLRLEAKTQTIFAYHNDKIDVHTEHAHYVMSEDDFVTLYQDASFSIYAKKPNVVIDADKDEVYYTQWRK